MRAKFYLSLLLIIAAQFAAYTTRAQNLNGNYNDTGFFFHPTSSRSIILQKTIYLIDYATQQYEVQAADGGLYFYFTVDATNHLTNFRIINGGTTYFGGFMTIDNPAGYSYYPGNTTGYTSNVYNNTYDPVTQTFYMHYGYNNTGDSTTGQTTYTRQIYEKYTAVAPAVFPVIISFSPASGTFGTQVSVKGSGFNEAFQVYFGGTNSDSFRVVSDSEIIASVGAGSTGHVSVTNYSPSTGTYPGSSSVDSFFYTPVAAVHDTNWQPVGSQGFSAGRANSVNMAMDTAGLPYVVYQDKTKNNGISVMHLGADSVWRNVGNVASPGAASFPNIAIGSDNIPYIAFIDSVSASRPAVTVSKYTGSNWQVVGTPAVDSTHYNYATVNQVPLALDGSNRPYFLSTFYNTSSLDYQFYVHTFTGSSWQTVGGSDIGIESGYGDASMAIDKLTNTIYVVSDNGRYENYQGIVARYRNNVWDTVPSGYITNNRNGVFYPDIAIDKWGDPSVSFQDDNGPEQISVYSLTGNRFYPYGQKYFSSNHAYRVSLTVSEGGITPFVFYNDGSYNNLGTVMMPNINGDGSWQYVGLRGFAATTLVTGNSVATDKAGVPYVAFADTANGYKVTVLKYGGYDLFTPRTRQELYSDSACQPWAASYPGWKSYNSEDTTGTHIEIQTQSQDAPGNICGFQSYIDSSSTYRSQMFGDALVVLSPRNYRIAFSDSNFTQPVGIRLFGVAAELDTLVAQASAQGVNRTTDDIVIYRYDGPNEDYMPGNNQDYHLASADSGLYASNYTAIKPTIHYYGTNNEYYYLEFYTSHFSEFYSGITTASLLPVNLLGFSASLQGKMTSVTWQTSNEVNTSYFTVQRSTDGVHFTSVGKVNAAGTGGSHNYSYGDALSGITSARVYYRLLMTDKDGSVKQSNIISVDMAANKLITIQPNPARSYAVIKFSMGGTKTVTVTDMNGRKVLVKTTDDSSETIAVGSLAKGMYLIRTDYVNGYDIQKLLVE